MSILSPRGAWELVSFIPLCQGEHRDPLKKAVTETPPFSDERCKEIIFNNKNESSCVQN